MASAEQVAMTAEDLRNLAVAIRNDKETTTDDDLVKRVRVEVVAYRAIYAENPRQLPVAPLDGLLPLMGWVIYEATWDAVQKIPPTLDARAATEEQLRRGEIALEQISDLADAARALPWPEYAPRALGAIRSQALAESKRDTETGYDAAWTIHQEARRRYREYRDSHAKGEARERFVRDLDEVLLQLALAETGTACRTAERVITRWAEEFAGEEEERWLERMFRDLSAGVEIGEQAIDTARRIRDRYGFVDAVTEERLTMRTALQNPGIMTARAAALLLALGPEMRRRGRQPAAGFPTWDEWQAHVLSRFEKAYYAIEDPVTVDGKPVAIREDLWRQLIHMRMNLALMKPGYHLPSTLSLHPVLALATLDDEALEALSDFLAPKEGDLGRERGIGAATMPAFIRSVRACRGLGPDDDGYDRWRLAWFRLDRFATEPARRSLVERALATAR